MSRLRRGECALVDLPADVAIVLERCEIARRATRGWFDPWAMPKGLDPTGLVKGWAAMGALDALVEAGAARGAMVNAGGDIALSGVAGDQKAWRIGIRDPQRVDRLLVIVEGVGAVATSGNYERAGQLVDPHCGESCARLASATVTGPELDLADAYATALAVAGDDGLEFIASCAGYEALIVHHDGSWRATPDFPLAA